ncbi:DNA mismatch repair protein MutS [Candidatus Magnetomonas plexicatena]|nr:DNA mismatch repair protein MutS [Nitrospirales bacterium LBB_01]
MEFQELTPVMKQYFDLKKVYEDAILFFRFGDFYEMFGEDAIVASKVLQIALTARNKGKKESLPMCGIPYFAADAYLKKLIEAGHKVAVCEQIEETGSPKGIFKREIVRLVTPGTYEPENPGENTYIFSFYPINDLHGIAVSDISTGEFMVYETKESLTDEIHRFAAREIICPESLRDDIHYGTILKDFFVSYVSDLPFDFMEAYKLLLEHFKVSTLEGYGCEGKNGAISAAGGLISYLTDTQRSNLQFTKIKTLNMSSFMFIDAVTIRNLELVGNLKDSTKNDTLLAILENNLTPMGTRFLRDALLRPLIDTTEINKRLDAVGTLVYDYTLRGNLRAKLKSIQDIERITIKLIKGSANARDLLAVKSSVEAMPEIKELLNNQTDNYLRELAGEIPDFTSLIEVIEDSITDSPPASIRDGWIIRDGCSQDIDYLREIATKGKTFLSELEIKERSSSGINNLKVSYNKIFGYYIEVTKSYLHLVPPHFIRKQTLVNAERFITPELKEYENKIVGAEEKLKALEYDYFRAVVEKVELYAGGLKAAANAIAVIDYLQSLAETAKAKKYVKPEVHSGGEIVIKGGRHPVIEKTASVDKFIPNDCVLDTEDNRMLIITGPNMAGKSTYMRQNALIILMAQMGSFVPADSAKIGVTDRIFTRIGASDFLAKGQSTFMVEMIETSNIVNNATKQSLIILDEVGRGTSTFDGISIAWAVAEHIVNSIGARTLFATHYNELTDLVVTTLGVKNYNVSVKEWGDEIIFLRKIVKGAADKSYGIQVARLAGLPDSIVTRAKDILLELEKKEVQEVEAQVYLIKRRGKTAIQLDLFSSQIHPAVLSLINLDLKKLTPDEALNTLAELKKLAAN